MPSYMMISFIFRKIPVSKVAVFARTEMVVFYSFYLY